MSKNTIYLVDGTSICYRSFFAIKLSTSMGRPTGGVYGFYKILQKIISKYNPICMGVCFDVSRKTFRQDKFQDYKGHRPPAPEGLKEQIPTIKQLLKFMGIAVIEKEGYEADDVIATLCREACHKGKKVVVISSDKDMYQLLNEGQVAIYNSAKEKVFTENDFMNDFGFEPEFMVDYLSLVGDAADNVPGARGIGKVGAAKLIKEFKTVETIFNNVDKLSLKVKDLLLQSKDDIFLSKELVQLYKCELSMGADDLKIGESDTESLRDLFRELEFKALFRDLSPERPQKEIIVKEAKTIPNKETATFFIDGDYVYFFDGDTYKLKLKDAKSILEDESIKKISHGFKRQMISSGIKINGILFDTKIAAYLADSTFGDYSLLALGACYLDDCNGDVPAAATPYFINELYKHFSSQIREKEMQKLLFNVEMPLITVLAEMEKFGVKVNVQTLQKLLLKVDERLKVVVRKIFAISGHEFNLNSPKQLSAVLFGELGITPLKKTKTGFSTGEEVLQKLSISHDIASFILDYRTMNKLKTTYILPIIESVKKGNGKLHAQFNQTAAQTGRLSSSSPNLQSIPVKGEFADELRQAFVSSFEEGCLISGDYSQIELRILAHYSGDKKLQKAFNSGVDVHRYTASLLFDTEEVDSHQRNIAKRVNFGILYGMSSYGLSRELKIAPKEAETFIEDYFSRYPQVKEYIKKVHKDLEENGFVKTILSRERKLMDYNSPNPHLREFARRQAVNTPIQGSCADLIKVAMVKIADEFKKYNLKSRMIIQIHDELIFDVSKNEYDQVVGIIKKNMQESIKLDVPIEVKIKVGKTWANMENESKV
ncbi:MAG: DNA polymerase I [Candidatus Omnitrophica bacterium]|nr:DNA polymerase I [Candidatus Omnitrophota bacterium]